MSSPNPFESPQFVEMDPSSRNQKLPAYSIVVIIVDLVFRAMRFLIVLLGLIAVFAMKTDDDIFAYGVLEVITGGMMVVFGGFGDILLLMKKRSGAMFCWVALAATIANMVVGIAEVPLQIQNGSLRSAEMPNQEAVLIAAGIGAVLVLIFRLGLVVAYGIGVYLASRALRK